MSTKGYSTKPKPSKNKEVVAMAIEDSTGQPKRSAISRRNQRRIMKKLERKLNGTRPIRNGSQDEHME